MTNTTGLIYGYDAGVDGETENSAMLALVENARCAVKTLTAA